jgi:pyruvate/2-oxoacid:ferredoxin oxidoreductase beta subunit/intein/homing endonuclease
MRLTIPEEELITAGHKACQGCSATLAMRYALKALGDKTIVVIPACCWTVLEGEFPYTCMKIPLLHTAFETAASASAGVRAALKVKGKNDVNVMAWAGDGGTFDIGLQALSGAVERNDDFFYVCYDNEGYMNCLSTSSLILTKYGLKKITDVIVGEDVYAFDLNTHQLVLKECTGVFDNGIKDVYEVQTLHHSIKATGNHPFLILKRNGRGKENSFVWKMLEELKTGDEIVTLKNIDEGESFRFDFNKTEKGDYKVNRLNEVNIPEFTNPDLMKYLGLYVGDGWVRTEKGEVGFALPEGSEGRKVLIEIHSKLFGGKINTDDVYIYIHSVNIARFIDKLGFGSGAKNKIVPSWIFTLPREEKECFVEGLMLSDGYTIGKSGRYVSASYELLRTLRLFLQTMSYRVGKIHQQTKKKGTKVVNRELLNDSEYGYICFSKRERWNVERYQNQYKYQNFLINNKYFEMEKIKQINFIGKEQTLDLRVEGEHNFIADGIVVHNTGIQRSSSTPFGAWTTTTPIESFESTHKKNIMEIMVAHDIPYAATACVAYPEDLVKKMQKAKDIRGSKFIHVLAPCPPGWRFPASQTINISRLAVETCVFPLYEVENGKYTISRKPKKKLLKEYLEIQGRFKHLTDEIIELLQSRVDEAWEKLLKKEEDTKG